MLNVKEIAEKLGDSRGYLSPELNLAQREYNPQVSQMAASVMTPEQMEENRARKEKEHRMRVEEERRMRVAMTIVGLAKEYLIKTECQPEVAFSVAEDFVKRAIQYGTLG